MKPHRAIMLGAFHRNPGPRRGVALLLVLGCLVLLTALILALIISSQNNLKSSKLYANGSSVKTLADSTVSLVMAQIQQATSNGTQVAWASQPGMIRTYDNTGKPLTNYRLFSWDAPTVSGTYTASNDAAQLAATGSMTPWYGSPAVFVDLNQPVADAKGTLHFPIIDGNPGDLVTYTTPAPASTSVLTYTPYTGTFNGQPVTIPQIEGFWVIPPNTAAAAASGNSPAISAGPAVNSKTTTPSNSTNNSIPMPVKWLYVLKDGTVVAPAAASAGTTVTINAASTLNPIVGRIAYWTDDETAKVNINTASEGNFADTPRAQGVTDFALAKYPTVQNEYQRYPGHPAMTCLSSVLGSLFPVDHSLQPSLGGYYTSPAPASYTSYQPYYDLAPKLNVDAGTNLGSQAGTVSVTSGAAALSTKTDRLYSSVDELMFSSNLFTDNAHTASGTVTGASGTRPLTTSGTFTQAFLEKAKFFLTANSRAPDVNMFNQPRILTWPLNANTGAAYRTPFDQAIAFCGTINNNAYYFTRSRPDHPTFDLDDTSMSRNRTLLSYLQTLTSQPVPGFGGSFTTKYTTQETDQILTEAFDYIRCLNLIDQSNATMTHPFAPVATIANGSLVNYAGTNGFGSASTLTGNAGQGCVVPIYDANTKTKGFGRFPTISEVSLIFICTGWNDGQGGLSTDINAVSGRIASTGTGFTSTTTTGTVTNYYWGYYNDGTNGKPATTPPSPAFKTIEPVGTAMPVIPGGNVQVQAALLVTFFDPSEGNVQESDTQSVQVLGLDGFQWGANSGTLTNMGFPGAGASNTACTSNMASSKGAQYVTAWGGNMGFRGFIATEGAGLASNNNQYYPFFSGAQNFPYNTAGGSTFYFSGGTISLNILLPSNTPNYPPSNWPTALLSANPQTASRAPLQQINITFPAATLPLPIYPVAALGNTTGSFPCDDRGNFNKRFGSAASNFGCNAEFTCAQDVVRSVHAYPGDIRMIAGLPIVTDTGTTTATAKNYFDSSELQTQSTGSLTSWNYFNSSSTGFLVHSLRESVDYPFWGAILGQLVPVTGPTYAGQAAGGAPIINNYGSGLNSSSGAGNNSSINGAFIGGGASGNPGDWDNGMGYCTDGPYINKPDEGDYNFTNGMPYFGETNYNNNNSSPGVTFFSPNRLMSGPGMFGSLPTGVIRNIPWQTLLFCPNPPAGPAHPGFGAPSSGAAGPTAQPPFSTPPDHLIMDLFNMPVVQPYPITEPLSTAGRINLNYQIVPFTYIERSTGLRAVLKSERMTVIPDNKSGSYKAASGTSASLNSTPPYDYRVPINSDQTLLVFDSFFTTTNDIFRSASQVCNMFLYPARDALLSLTAGPLWDPANANITKFWNGNTTGNGYNVSQATPTNTTWPTHYLTGDNSREKPYADIYPRLTTKSNTFTIHYYVQTLQKVIGSNPTLWNDAVDKVTGEYRGSTTVERYVNPNDSTLPDFAAKAIAGTPQALDSFYKFRVVNERQFAP